MTGIDMTPAIWKDGRFSWGVIAAVLFVTVSLVAFDLAWRAVKLAFDTLLIYCVIVDLAAAVVLFLAFRVCARMRRRSR
ncbi:MAG TPA: hypothetical protein VNV18_19285 [Stellaceae bacterium]|jgi:hypothetical protein|nr:hypothetical protein [Stellaceae bacterium]